MKHSFAILFLLACTSASFAQLSGPLSGTLGPGIFHVIGTISINSGDSLRLQPGTTFMFDLPVPFNIYGTLLAEGTEGDSIIFTTDTVANPSRWRGLDFFDYGSSHSRIAYCGIRHARDPQGNGGGAFCSFSSPYFSNCTFSGNSASGSGGGVYCLDNCSPTFSNCTLSGNSAQHGGGVSCGNSLPSFTSCTISGNSAQYGGGVSCGNSSPSFSSCTISSNSAGNFGGGVYCSLSSPFFTNCTISGNSVDGDANAWGGGVVCVSYSTPVLSNCTISGNSATYCGGVYCNNSSPVFSNCTISGNSATYCGGVYCQDNSMPSFTHCTLGSNRAEYNTYGGGVYCSFSLPVFTNTIIAFSQGQGVFFHNSRTSQFEYCDIFGNSGGNIANPSHGPPGIGQIVGTNANGDSCDQYFNIFLDPMFVDMAEGDYHLLAGSPCIDAGDPTLPHDPDGTIADIGAYYYDQSAVEPIVTSLPMAYALHPNWPNPFNSTTMIRYDVPQAGQLSLTIYNLLGQRVATPFDGRQLAGTYTVAWDAANLPSGLYFCRMDAAGFAQTKKMMLVK